MHAHRVAHALLLIHRPGAGCSVDDVAVVRNGNGPRRLERPLHVLVGDAVLRFTHRRHPMTGRGADVIARHTDERPLDALPGRLFGSMDRFADRRGGIGDIDHHPAPQAARRCLSHPNDVNRIIAGYFTHQGADLACADIDASHQVAHRRTSLLR